jgi:glycosyltransferase involved in cell wall biosynthesis
VGAKDVVTEGTNGWVIPADDADSLGEQMQWCARHPGEVAAMQQAAMDAARDFTWAAYRNRVVSVIEAILEGENEKSVNSGVHTLS